MKAPTVSTGDSLNERLNMTIGSSSSVKFALKFTLLRLSNHNFKADRKVQSLCPRLPKVV